MNKPRLTAFLLSFGIFGMTVCLIHGIHDRLWSATFCGFVGVLYLFKGFAKIFENKEHKLQSIRKTKK